MQGLRELVSAAVAAGLMTLCAGGAMAQTPSQQPPTDEEVEEGMYCVYEELASTDDTWFVGEIFLTPPDEVDDIDMDDANELVMDATSICSDHYKWNDEQSKVAREIALLTSGGDVLVEHLADLGVSDAAIGGVMRLIDELPDEEIDIFFDETWGQNAAFLERMKNRIVAKGVKDSQDTIGTSLDIMNIQIMVTERELDFMLAKLADKLDEKP